MLPQVYTAAQAQNCPTFSVPPLDGSVLNGELIDWHIDHSKDHKFAVLVAEGDDENVYSTFAECEKRSILFLIYSVLTFFQ